jgi:RHS repeat-associated protein
VVWEWVPGTFQPVSQSERRWEDGTQEWADQQFYAIVADLIGTPTELVDTDGNIAWQGRRSVWGVHLSGMGPAYTPLRFPGHYFDPETQLNYNYHRYYDATTGRYGSADPLGLTPAADPHGYVSNPHRWIDPLGLSPYGTSSDDDLTRVGRWMSLDEYQQMVNTRVVQEGSGGTTYVAHPADPAAYGRQAASGTGYAEFDVPTSSLAPAGKPGWAQIPGPNSLYARLAARRGLQVPQFPAALNISDWMGPK